MRRIIFIPFIIFPFISACSGIIEYSPFDTDVKSRNLNPVNATRIIRELDLQSDTLKFAMVSDIHENYEDLSDAIANINMLPDVSFILCGGDIANNGFAQEFEWYVDVMEESDCPVITVIGNHDCRSNGRIIYERLFGPADFSFDIGQYKFILFNSVIWENSGNSPEYDWLKDQISGNTYNILVAHLYPSTIDMGALHRQKYNQIVDSTNTILSLHGSAHSFSEYLYNGIHSVISASIDKREYLLIKLFNNQAEIKRVYF